LTQVVNALIAARTQEIRMFTAGYEIVAGSGDRAADNGRDIPRRRGRGDRRVGFSNSTQPPIGGGSVECSRRPARATRGGT
jgi:hypothetical protein